MFIGHERLVFDVIIGTASMNNDSEEIICTGKRVKLRNEEVSIAKQPNGRVINEKYTFSVARRTAIAKSKVLDGHAEGI